MGAMSTQLRTRLYCTPSLAAALLLAASAGVAAAQETRTIWENGDEYVRVVARDGAQGARNDHPVKIAPRTLTAMLSGLRATPAKKSMNDTVVAVELGDAIPLFSPATAQRLGKTLSAALRKATPHQDAVFQVRDNTSLIGFISQPVHTTGRVFWKNRRLHAIFGSIHKGIVKRMVMGRKAGVVNPPRQAGRGVIGHSDYRVAPTPGVRYARMRNGTTRGDWVLIDPDIATTKMSAEDVPAAARTAPPAANSLEKRLRRLKKLRRDGLISEKDYRDKVRGILDEL